LRFIFVTGVGIAFGLGIGAVGVLLLRLVHEAELEIMVTLVIAYGSYLGADVVHASGVVSVVVAGIVVARYGSSTGRLKGTQLLGFWNVLAFVLNGILFLMVGIAVPTTRLISIGGLALGAYLIMFAARAIPVYALLGLADIRGSSIPWSWRHMTVWGGIRGALSVALALSVATNPHVNATVSVLAYGMVVLSLLIQGGLLLPVADLLGLHRAAASPG
jgi:CPA1 family monovalent cation:H+ antiporter